MKTVYVLMRRLPDEFEAPIAIIMVYEDYVLAAKERMHAEDDAIVKGTEYFVVPALFRGVKS